MGTIIKQAWVLNILDNLSWMGTVKQKVVALLTCPPEPLIFLTNIN